MNNKKMHVAIVGAGPAGLFAAERLAQAGLRVTVFERMPSPARKFLMAGRGGLNLTHSEPLGNFLARYDDPAGLIKRAIEAFPPSALIEWANGLGAETFVGSSGRVFPKVMKASPLLRAWLMRLAELGVKIETRQTWKGFAEDGTLLIEDARGEAREINTDAVLLALGGASWPKLGSDGAWSPILAEHSVEIAPLEASNCGVTIHWSDVFREKFHGQPLKRIALTCGTETIRGEAIVTAHGLEGGAIYALSGAIRTALRHGPAPITTDLRPDLSEDSLAAQLAKASAKESAANVLRKFASLSPVAAGLVREAGPLPRSSAERARRIKSVPLQIVGTSGLARAISTAGGIAAEAIDDCLMLRALPGVFVAGEMLDFDAPTGGYLLQACLATGAQAAAGIGRFLGTTA